jgi:hypothetical protein
MEIDEKIAIFKERFHSFSFYLHGLDAPTQSRLTKRIKELGAVMFLSDKEEV